MINRVKIFSPQGRLFSYPRAIELRYDYIVNNMVVVGSDSDVKRFNFGQEMESPKKYACVENFSANSCER